MDTLTATFDRTTHTGPATVIRAGKLFEPGNWPDKKFSLTAAELREAEADFQPVPIDLEHVPTVLDGKLGRLERVRVGADGRTLYGAVALPRWLHEALGPDPLKVSCTWDRQTKRLQKLALVVQPRIIDAELLAAFSAAGEPTLGECCPHCGALDHDSEGYCSECLEPWPDPEAAFKDGGKPKGHWVTVDGHAVFLTDQKASGGHVDKAVARHGVGAQGAKALKAAHAAGHVETHRELYRVVSHAKKLQKGGLNEKLAYKTALDAHKAGKSPALEQAAAPSPKGVTTMPTDQLHVDPERFQYKVMVGKTGVSGELKEVKQWNPNLAGVILAWHDPADGKSYVVNGHHRHDLASRLGAKELDVRHIEAPDAATARYIGAMANIAEGRGTAIDAAKLLRESGTTPQDLEKDGVSLRGKLAQDGLALSKLPESIWGKVYRGELTPARGAAIGGADLSHSEQLAMQTLLEGQEKRGKRLTDAEVSELARHVKSAGHTTTQTSNLFGEEEIQQSLAIEKAQLSAYLKKRLGTDKRLFGYVAKGNRAEELARAGNTIQVSESQKLAEQSAQVEEVFNRLAHRSGPLAGALNGAAARLAKGEPESKIREELYGQVRSLVAGTHGGAAKGGPSDAENAARRPDDHTSSLFSGTAGRGPNHAPPAHGYPGGRGTVPMKLWDRVKQALHLAGVDTEADVADFSQEEAEALRQQGAAAAAQAAAQAEAERHKAEAARLRNELLAAQTARINAEAAAFADGEIAAKRAFPAERPALLAAFTQAAKDDVASPAEVTFSAADGKEQKGNRTAALRALYAARTPHTLTEELLRTEEGGQALFNRGKTDEPGKEATPDKKRVEELCRMTPMGQAAFSANGKS